eukprot:2401558-Alexandrium_andersonii.AAC.1
MARSCGPWTGASRCLRIIADTKAGTGIVRTSSALDHLGRNQAGGPTPNWTRQLRSEPRQMLRRSAPGPGLGQPWR